MEHKRSTGKNVAVVIPLQRRRPLNANPYSAEAFWRKSMVPASIGMGVIIVAAVATLGVGVKTGWLGHDSSKWVLVAALVSVIGLTKDRACQHVFLSPDAGRGAVGSAARAAAANARNTG